MSYSSTVLADNPGLYWRLDDTSSIVVNSGTLGSAYNGTLVGGNGIVQSVSGLLVNDSDTATSFPNNNTAAAISSNSLTAIEAYTTWSYELWFKPTTLPSTGQTLLVWDGIPFLVYLQSSPAKVCAAVNAEATTVTSSNTYTLNATHHLVVTYDGTTLTLWLNGVSTAVAVSVAIGSTANYLHLGGSVAYGGSVAGTYDEFAIYPTALSAARVNAHYLAGSSLALAFSDTGPAISDSFVLAVTVPLIFSESRATISDSFALAAASGIALAFSDNGPTISDSFVLSARLPTAIGNGDYPGVAIGNGTYAAGAIGNGLKGAP